MTRTPLIIAHRGSSADAPENTLAAFQVAIDAGADGVEFDVQLSKDIVPVVIHDYDLRRVASRPEKIADLTSTQLAGIDVGSWFASKFPARDRPAFSIQTVPTLEQVLGLHENADGPIYVELKCETGDFTQLVSAVCDILRRSPILPRIVVKSFRLGAIAMVRDLLPDVVTAALFEPSIMTILRSKKYIIAMAREFRAHQISLHYSLATPKLVALAGEANMPVIVWTVDDKRSLARYRRLGIASLITNDPAMMISA